MTSDSRGQHPQDPFADLADALAAPSRPGSGADDIRVDPARRRRTGAPEIVYGRGKTPEQVVRALRRIMYAEGRALATRCDAAAMTAVAAVDGWQVVTDPVARTVTVWRDGQTPEPATRGPVGILSAGSSDLPVVGEVQATLREVGVAAVSHMDVGVAGLHRLVGPLRDLTERDVAAIIVVAGMDGALPSVVAGLVDRPVIAVPTSTGYGFGGDGEGALMAMLQSCAPGLVLVNIDNGVGAALAAARIVATSHPGAGRTTGPLGPRGQAPL